MVHFGIGCLVLIGGFVLPTLAHARGSEHQRWLSLLFGLAFVLERLEPALATAHGFDLYSSLMILSIALLSVKLIRLERAARRARAAVAPASTH